MIINVIIYDPNIDEATIVIHVIHRLTGEATIAYRLLMTKNYWKGELIKNLGRKDEV